MHFFDKVLQHFFGNLEIGDNTVFQRTDSRDIARRSPQHALSIDTHGLNNLLP